MRMVAGFLVRWEDIGDCRIAFATENEFWINKIVFWFLFSWIHPGMYRVSPKKCTSSIFINNSCKTFTFHLFSDIWPKYIIARSNSWCLILQFSWLKTDQFELSGTVLKLWYTAVFKTVIEKPKRWSFLGVIDKIATGAFFFGTPCTFVTNDYTLLGVVDEFQK